MLLSPSLSLSLSLSLLWMFRVKYKYTAPTHTHGYIHFPLKRSIHISLKSYRKIMQSTNPLTSSISIMASLIMCELVSVFSIPFSFSTLILFYPFLFDKSRLKDFLCSFHNEKRNVLFLIIKWKWWLKWV